jgi:hypothetical protein
MEPVRVTTEKIDGYLLTFTDSEFTSVKAMLVECGYSTDSDGLKKFILDSLEDEEPHNPAKAVAEQLGDFITGNPAIVNAGLDLAGNLLRKGLGKIRR